VGKQEARQLIGTSQADWTALHPATTKAMQYSNQLQEYQSTAKHLLGTFAPGQETSAALQYEIRSPRDLLRTVSLRTHPEAF